MDTTKLYRLVAKVNGDDVEILNEITTIDFAEDIRQMIYKTHPELSIYIQSYLKFINFTS